MRPAHRPRDLTCGVVGWTPATVATTLLVRRLPPRVSFRRRAPRSTPRTARATKPCLARRVNREPSPKLGPSSARKPALLTARLPPDLSRGARGPAGASGRERGLGARPATPAPPFAWRPHHRPRPSAGRWQTKTAPWPVPVVKAGPMRKPAPLPRAARARPLGPAQARPRPPATPGAVGSLTGHGQRPATPARQAVTGHGWKPTQARAVAVPRVVVVVETSAGQAVVTATGMVAVAKCATPPTMAGPSKPVTRSVGTGIRIAKSTITSANTSRPKALAVPCY